MIATLIALLLSAFAALFPPAPAAHRPPAPVASAPTSSHGRASAGGVDASVPTSHPAPASTVAAPTDVAQQQPGESNGRQVDCPDGVHVGVMVDGAVTGCP